MPELLLELLSEEIPARMQRRAIEDLTGLLREKLVTAEVAAENLCGYVTPRRLTVIAEGIARTQPGRTEERRGPRVGAPPQAIDGFLRSVGLADSGECEIRDTGRGEFYFAVIKRSGRPVAEVLPDLIKAAITELPWQKSMRWPGSPLRWVRPLTSVLCLYDGEVLPLALDGVSVGRTTRGHRFLSPGEFCANSAAEYLEKLQHACVVVDQEQRRELIRADLDGRASELGVNIKSDPGLLDEVTGLAEFPVVFAGSIDTDFMSLPPEVLQTAMRVHQKYFSSVYADGRPAPHFMFVANNLADDGGKAIIAGNERVLRARLADARFFWDQDRKIRLEDRVEALNGRVYHDKLGSVYDKIERMEKLAEFLAQQLYAAPPAVAPAQAGVQGDRSDSLLPNSRFRGNDDGKLKRSAQRAARLAKADLSTGMVGEFPELQGIMGRYYALHDGEEPAVANAIAQHYRPLGPNDSCPTAPISIVVALADKIDSLVGFFGINEKPTGSRDPFGLRRAGLGLIRLILENRLRLSLIDAFKLSYKTWVVTGSARTSGAGPFGIVDATDELLEFIAERLKVHLRDAGVRHDLIAAVFANPLAQGSLLQSEVTSLVLGSLSPGAPEDDLVRLIARVEALSAFLETEDGANLLVAYRRASNIVAIEERKGDWTAGKISSRLLCENAETDLSRALDRSTAVASIALRSENFEDEIAALATLRQPIDAFFEKVTVNTDNEKLRENRLRLLARIRDTMNRVADFSQIEG